MKSQIENISGTMLHTEMADHFLDSLPHETHKNIGLVFERQKIRG